MVYEFVIPYLYWSRSGGIKNIEVGVKLLEHIRLTSQNRTDFCSTSQPFLSPPLNVLMANFIILLYLKYIYKESELILFWQRMKLYSIQDAAINPILPE